MSAPAFPHNTRFNSINDIRNVSNETICFVVVSEVCITPQGNILGWKIQLTPKTEEIYVNTAYAGANNLLRSRGENPTKKCWCLCLKCCNGLLRRRVPWFLMQMKVICMHDIGIYYNNLHQELLHLHFPRSE